MAFGMALMTRYLWAVGVAYDVVVVGVGVSVW
jgi:hypothetical protein